jgi:hypothetical protein
LFGTSIHKISHKKIEALWISTRIVCMMTFVFCDRHSSDIYFYLSFKKRNNSKREIFSN